MKTLPILLLGLLMSAGLQGQSGQQYSDGLVHGIYRTYILYIPSSYVQGRAVPLLVSLHGFTESADYQNSLANFKPIADTAKFIIAMPDGQPNRLFFDFVGWNVFPISSGVDDPGFLAKLIDTVSNRYTIDRNRIYFTGHSGGAIMSYELACSMSDRIAAIAPVNGFMFPSHMNACRPIHPVPVIEIHGTSDPVRSWNGVGPVTQAVHMDSMISHWVRVNGCSPVPRIDTLPDINRTDNSWVQRFTYSGGTYGSSVELYKVINGGHTWPGSSVMEPYGNTNKDFNACVAIWKFLSKYRLNILSGMTDQASETTAIRIFPNPVGDRLQVRNTSGQAIRGIRVRNLLGQTVYSMDGPCMDESLTIDSSGWVRGIYVISFQHGNELISSKLIR